MRASGDTVVVLFCFAETAPGDLWLPLAESLEFIPVDEAAATSAPGPTPQPTVLEE